MSVERKSRSREGAWIEITGDFALSILLPVAPARERGLKSRGNLRGTGICCRSREGAWIEIRIPIIEFDNQHVAPARERGLKSVAQAVTAAQLRRSREGAWIEIDVAISMVYKPLGRSREGAWIEIVPVSRFLCGMRVAPARERGLKYP